MLVLPALLLACLLVPARPAAAESYLGGDVNGDGTVSAADAAVVLRAAAGRLALDNAQSARADVTASLTVGASDATAILLYCTGRLDSFDQLTGVAADSLLGDRFLEKFSYQGPVATDSGYRSSRVSVTLEERSFEGSVAHVADLYIHSVESLCTAFAGGAPRAGRSVISELAAQTDAVLAVNGDNVISGSSGPLIRNGVWYRSGVDQDSDACVLYCDGVMETYEAGKADRVSIVSRAPWQSWVYGPRLLDDAGKALTRFNCPTSVLARSARTALGYYEPGHYVLVAVDGSQNPDSTGMTCTQLAAFMESLGCKAAYNLCGGLSSVMLLCGAPVCALRDDGRESADILYIAG